jgi:hypothetical protein
MGEFLERKRQANVTALGRAGHPGLHMVMASGAGLKKRVSQEHEQGYTPPWDLMEWSVQKR